MSSMLLRMCTMIVKASQCSWCNLYTYFIYTCVYWPLQKGPDVAQKKLRFLLILIEHVTTNLFKKN